MNSEMYPAYYLLPAVPNKLSHYTIGIISEFPHFLTLPINLPYNFCLYLLLNFLGHLYKKIKIIVT